VPYLETGRLPYQTDESDRAGNTSRAGAEAIAPYAGNLCARYAELLARHEFSGLTDEEAADLLSQGGPRIERTTVIARRHELADQVECIGQRKGPHGVNQKVYRLAHDARQGAA
jgi:hypothetical protein